MSEHIRFKKIYDIIGFEIEKKTKRTEFSNILYSKKNKVFYHEKYEGHNQANLKDIIYSNKFMDKISEYIYKKGIKKNMNNYLGDNKIWSWSKIIVKNKFGDSIYEEGWGSKEFVREQIKSHIWLDLPVSYLYLLLT